MAFLFRLLALAAIILMPMGMGTGPAAAAAQASKNADQDGHCEQKPANDPDTATAMPCGGLCSALPADPANVSVHYLPPVARACAPPVAALHGVLPPPSTPPPRLG